jgi:hypothetical protein
MNSSRLNPCGLAVLGAALVAACGAGPEPDESQGLGALELAARVHLQGGPQASPSFSDLGLLMEASGRLVGIGNVDAVLTLKATGQPVAVCTNPSGRNQPPGRNPAEVSLVGTQSIPREELRNGSFYFDLITQEPERIVAGAPDCPNARWTETITDVAFTSATLTLEQPAGQPVLSVECLFSLPTHDGPLAVGTVSCATQRY